MITVGLIGLGTVGTGIYEGLTETKIELASAFGEEVRIEKILVKDGSKKREIDVPVHLLTDEENVFLSESFDVVFEAIGGITSAKKYIRFYLEKGIPVITANKELIAKHGEELETLARENDTFLGYEAAVAGGIPIINVLRSNLQWSRIEKITGIINGTTNYILTEMNENDRSFEEVLREAQALGYAEADPTDDVEGYDALYKIRILSRLCFGVWPEAKDFTRTGIREIEAWHVDVAKELGLTVKLVAEASVQNGTVTGSVAPCFLTKSHGLSHIHGVTNAVCLTADPIGDLILAGPGAGKGPTSASMIEDFIHLSTKKEFVIEKRRKSVSEEKKQRLLLVENDQFSALHRALEQVTYETICIHEATNKKGWVIELTENEWKKIESDIGVSWYTIHGEVKVKERAV